LTGPSGYGYVNTSLCPWDNGTLSVAKLEYITQTQHLSNGTQAVNVFLEPLSSDGLVRIVFQDVGLIERRGYCVYFNENMRLKGCYNMTDEVRLLINKNYTIVPYIEAADLISTPNNLKNFLHIFIPYLFGAGFAAAFLMILLAMIQAVTSKRRKR
jgi:hypothetical protein